MLVRSSGPSSSEIKEGKETKELLLKKNKTVKGNLAPKHIAHITPHRFTQPIKEVITIAYKTQYILLFLQLERYQGLRRLDAGDLLK